MKKITLLAAVIVVASFASCKKIRTCKCTFSDGSSISVNSTAKLSKKDAKTWCEGSTSGGTGYSCSLEK